MIKAFYTVDLTEAVLLKDHLVQNGVAASVRNKGAVRIPYAGVASEVWVADDVDGDEVRTLIRSFLKTRKEPATDNSSWQCRACKEHNPGAFEFCWSCGHNQDTPTY